MKLSIKCGEIEGKEKSKIALATKNYYENKLIDSQTKTKFLWATFGICLLFAVLFFSLLIVCHHFNFNFILTEIIDVIVWIFLWEALDILIFQRGLLSIEKKRNTMLYKSKIVFD